MSDKVLDHILGQNEMLTRFVLDMKTTGAAPVSEGDSDWSLGPQINALEAELAEANQTIAALKTSAGDYEKLRDTLFREREENRESEQGLQTAIDLLKTQKAGLERTIAEHEAWRGQAQARFNQLEEELKEAQTTIDNTPITPDGEDWRGVERLLNLALQKFEENPDSSFANLQRAYSKVAGHIPGDEQ